MQLRILAHVGEPTSRRADQVDLAASEIEALGGRSLRVTSDVSDRATLERVLDEGISAFGKVDILVNSAGRTKRAPTIDFFRRGLEGHLRH